MKKKFYIIILMSLFLLAAGAFHYEGSQSRANATENTVVESEIVTNVENEMIESQNNGEDVSSTLLLTGTEADTENGTDEIIIDNEVYVNIMNDEKFADLSNVARNNGAKLYAIPYSGCFAIVKDGTPIFHMSAGVKAAHLDHANILSEAFALGGFETFTGLSENINQVLETGKEVSVELSEYEGYVIYQEDGWIITSW